MLVPTALSTCKLDYVEETQCELCTDVPLCNPNGVKHRSGYYSSKTNQSSIMLTVVSPKSSEFPCCWLKVSFHHKTIKLATLEEKKVPMGPMTTWSLKRTLVSNALEIVMKQVGHHWLEGLVKLEFKHNVSKVHFILDQRNFLANETHDVQQVINGSTWSLKEDKKFTTCRMYNQVFSGESGLDNIELLCFEKGENSKCKPDQVSHKLLKNDSSWILNVHSNNVSDVYIICALALDEDGSPKEHGHLHWTRPDPTIMPLLNPVHSHQDLTIGLTLSLAALVITFTVLVALCKLANQNATRKRLWSFVSQSSTSTAAEEEAKPEEELELAKTKCRLFELGCLELGKEIGSGQFGVVRRATLRDGSARWDVALKAAKDESGRSELKRESEIMGRVGYHENIVNLQGVTVCDDNNILDGFYLVLEYCSHGSLLEYLTDNFYKYNQALKSMYELQICGAQPWTAQLSIAEMRENFYILIAWGHQIARGMDFLSSKNIVHGDLAARNILLTSDMTAKLADFGLSTHLNENDQNSNEEERKDEEEEEDKGTKKKPFPFRWMAPEALKTRQSSKASDVWAYGVVLWEIFSLGRKPYKDVVSLTQLSDMFNNDKRLEAPEYCPAIVTKMMNQCWAYWPSERPTFEKIAAELDPQLGNDYRQRYEGIVNSMHERHRSIQNTMYFLMSGHRTPITRKGVSTLETFLSTDDTV